MTSKEDLLHCSECDTKLLYRTKITVKREENSYEKIIYYCQKCDKIEIIKEDL